jgi:hypothetical protein
VAKVVIKVVTKTAAKDAGKIAAKVVPKGYAVHKKRPHTQKTTLLCCFAGLRELQV